MMQWDPNSGIRERLALLFWQKGNRDRVASVTKLAHKAKYDPRADRWAFFTDRDGSEVVPVMQEGAASLEGLAQLGVSRADAMALIGYPEGGV